MSIHEPSHLPATRTDILMKQLDYLQELRTYHAQCMNDTNTEDYEIYRFHREIVDLIKPVTNRFQSLLESLPQGQEDIK